MKTINKKYRKYLGGSSFFYIICALAETYFAIILGKIIDGATESKQTYMLQNVAICVVIVLGTLVLYRIAIELRRTYTMKSISDIKQQLISSIYKRGIGAIQSQSDSYYMNLLSNDVDIIENDYFIKKPLLYSYGASLISAVVALFYISWKGTLLFFLFFLFPIIVPQLLSKVLAKQKKIASEKNELYTFELKEQIQRMDEIIRTISVSYFKKRFLSGNYEQQEAKRRAGVTENYISVVSSVCAMLSQLGCIAVGGLLVIRKEISVGELIASIQLLNSVFNPLSALSQILSVMKGSLPIREKIDKEIGFLSNDIKPKGYKLPDAFDINYDNYCTWYREGEPVIENFKHQFQYGKTYAVVGDSGCGKTTLFKSLLKSNSNYSGEATVGEFQLVDIPAEEIYRHIGYVSQKVSIFNDSIINNILLGKEIDAREFDDIIQKTQLSDLIKREDVNTGDDGRQLSGGEIQRIGIARVLVRNPSAIIFDEPTSSLDPDTKNAINELIFSLDQVTRIIITHDRRPEYLNRFDECIMLNGASK